MSVVPSLSPTGQPERKPHAILDHESRVKKATKIVAQLRNERELAGSRVLDVGSGGGMIAHELSRAVGPSGLVWGVDVQDLRTIHEGYHFALVKDTSLPFEQGAFDIVVTNHCLEHVGNRERQLQHLQEIHRVLDDGGLCYLALPNRWGLVEPHYRLPFLSWLPQPLRSPYVRLARRGRRYDCDMPRPAELERMIGHAGFGFREVTTEAMRLVVEIEQPGRLKRMLLTLPAPLVHALRGIIPTRMYVLRKL